MKIFFIFSTLAYIIFFSFFTQHTGWIEMVVYSYLANHNFLLYKDIIDPHTPILVWFLQIIQGFLGYSPKLLQVITIVLAVTNTFLIWSITKKLFVKEVLAYCAAMYYILWFFYFEGNGLWYELFQTPFILGTFYFFYNYFFSTSKIRDLLLGSLLLSVSFFIKQSATWIILIIGFWMLFYHRRNLRILIKNLSILILCLGILFALTSMVAAWGGYVKEYWYWAFYFTFLEFPSSSGHHVYPSFLQIVKLGIPLILLIPLIIELKSKFQSVLFSLLFLGALFMSIFPRWELFHLQPFLAVFSIITAPVLLKYLRNRNSQIVVSLIILIWTVVVLRQNIRFWGKPIRFFEPRMYAAAQQITNKGYLDFFTFNSWDHLYVLTNTLPRVKPYVQNFAWFMEIPGIQQKVVNDLQIQQPRFIIFSPFAQEDNFEIGNYRPKILSKYIEENYQLKEKVTEDIWVLQKK